MKKLILLFVTILAASTAYAEHCPMLGCEGRTGYVYIPEQVAYGYQEKASVTFNGEEYRLVGKEKFPFVEEGLPDVNSVVTVGDGGISFYRNQDVPKIIKSLKVHEDIKYDASTKVAEINPFIQPSFQMFSGAKVKILGYKQFGIPGIRDKLFVHILYLADK